MALFGQNNNQLPIPPGLWGMPMPVMPSPQQPQYPQPVQQPPMRPGGGYGKLLGKR